MAVIDAGEQAILRLNPADAKNVWPLSIEAGWNQVVADWQLMIDQGSAFGIKGSSGKWIASALALPLGAKVSWISMVLVTKPERGKGHGTRLLRRCIAEIEASGRVMGLDATEFGRPVYLPLGFRDVYTLSRWSVPATAAAPVAPPVGIGVRAAQPQDLPRIADYDLRPSGFERPFMLADLLRRAPGVAHVAERPDGSLAGYVLGRDGHRATHIGPTVAENQAVGLALVSRAMACVGGVAIMDVPDQQDSIRHWLQSHGGSASRRFMRMLRGDAPAVEDATRIMALAGPELA